MTQGRETEPVQPCHAAVPGNRLLMTLGRIAGM